MFKHLPRVLVSFVLTVVSVGGLLAFSSSSASASTYCPYGYNSLGGKTLTLVSGKQEAFATCAKGFLFGSNNSSFTVTAAPSKLPSGYCAVTMVQYRFSSFGLPSSWQDAGKNQNCAAKWMEPKTFSYSLSATDRWLGRTSIYDVRVATVVFYAGTGQIIGVAGVNSWK